MNAPVDADMVRILMKGRDEIIDILEKSIRDAHGQLAEVRPDPEHARSILYDALVQLRKMQPGAPSSRVSLPVKP